jgi:gliding motility-associated-like protein
MGNKLITLKLLLAFILVWILFPNAVLAQYCSPSYNNPCFNPGVTDDNINNFSTTGGITNISNLNTNCNGTLPTNYTYHPNMTVTVMRGNSFQVQVQGSQGIAGTSYVQGFKIWVDWDQNGVFENPTANPCEMAFSSGAASLNVFTGTITVPITAALGLTRMRIRSAYNTIPNGPCSNENYGETEDYSVMVLANPTSPGLTVQPVTICAGQSASLSATGGGLIKWYSAQNAGTFVHLGPNFSTPPLFTTTTYWVQTVVNGCTSQRIPVTVTVNPALTVTPTASVATVCAGESVILTGPAGYSSYTWTPAAVFANNQVNPATATIGAATTFTLTVTNSAGCSGSGTVNVGLDAAPSLTIVASDNAICLGETVNLTASGSTNGYNWLAADGLVASTSTSVTVNPSITTTFSVTANSTSGACPASASYSITVHPTPIVDAGIPQAFCAGSSVNLSASGAANYSWTPTNTLSSAIISNPVATPNGNTTYTVIGTSAFGCVATDEVEVTENQLPIAIPGVGGSQCFGETTQLNGSGGISYQWSPAAGLSSPTISNPVASPNLTTSYSLTVTDNNGCVSNPSAFIAVNVNQLPVVPVITNSGALTFCAGNDVTLSAAGGQLYSWSNGATSSSINVGSSGTFSVSITDINGCESPSSLPVSVIVNPNPIAPIITSLGSTTFCQGGDATLQANQPTGILWNNGATSSSITVSNTGQYTVQYTDPNGCESPESSPVQVNVTPLAATPSISASGPTEFCEGNSVVLTASHGENFIWSNGATSQSIVANQSGTYSVTISSSCPPLNPTNSQQVQVRPIPTPIITADIRKDCLPVEIQFNFSTNGIGPFNYLWTFGDGNSSATPQPLHEYSEDGIFDVSLKLTDIIGCMGDSLEIDFIEILKRPDVSISVNPSITTLSNSEIRLISQTSGGQNETWTINPLGTFTGDTVLVSMPDTGTFYVDFSVITEQGCEATIRKNIQVVEDFQIYIPTGFTPNNDGLNDTFKPVCSGCKLKGFDFRIYNRFGQEVFFTDNPEIGWDPQNVQSGTYIWKMIVRSLLNEDKIFEGHINIFR